MKKTKPSDLIRAMVIEIGDEVYVNYLNGGETGIIKSYPFHVTAIFGGGSFEKIMVEFKDNREEAVCTHLISRINR